MDDNLAKDLENAAEAMNVAAGPAPATGDEPTTATPSLDTNNAAETSANNVNITTASTEAPATESAAGVFSEPKVETDSSTNPASATPSSGPVSVKAEPATATETIVPSATTETVSSAPVSDTVNSATNDGTDTSAQSSVAAQTTTAPQTPTASSTNVASENSAQNTTPITSAPTANAPWNTVAQQPTTQNAAGAQPKKKSKKGLIIGCVIGGVVVAACAGFGIAYAVAEKPENVALSAISSLLTAKSKKYDTTFSLASTGDSSEVSSAEIHLLDQTNEAGEKSGTADLTLEYDGTKYNLSLGVVYQKDHTIYIQLSNLKDSIKSLVKTLSTNSEYSQYVSIYESLIDSVVGEVDGIWWKVSVPDLVDKVETDDDKKSEFKDAYSCFTDAIDKSSQNGEKYAEIYKNNAFVELTKKSGEYKTKGKAYDVKFDSEKLTNFENALTDEIDSLGIKSCLEKLEDADEDVSTSYEKHEVKKEDIDDSLKDLSNMVVTIDGGLFGHNITGFYAGLNSDSYTGNVSVAISDDPVVSAPSDTKDITSLYDNVEKAITDWSATSTCKVMKSQYPTYYTSYCDPATDKIRPEYQEMFGGTDQQTDVLNPLLNI